MRNIIIAGTDTNVGKTVTSAILAQMLKAHYWKPVSCAPEQDSDTLQVQKLVTIENFKCYPESYSFSSPCSPHQAAALANVEALSSNLCLPKTNNRLIIELAGGVLVPLNNSELLLETCSTWEADWILVSLNKLGSINHTLLTYEALIRRKVKIMGIVFNGEANSYSEKFITDYTDLPVIGRIFEEKSIHSKIIKRYAEQWSTNSYWREKNPC